jgi:hypothetical protein
MVHISVLERLGVASKGAEVYAPISAVGMLDVIQSTYEKIVVEENSVKIVSWAGKILNPEIDEDVVVVRDLIAGARQRVMSH